MVQGITADKFAVGYSGIGNKTSDVKSLKIAAKTGETQKVLAQAKVPVLVHRPSR